jgi:septal ring factor EnvC (AmiA/AmiB activator)
MDELKQHLDNVTSELNSTDANLQGEKQKSMQLHNTLKTKESLLNQTKDQLTNVLNSATVELSNLRGNLGKQTRALNMCQTVIGTKVTTLHWYK